MGLRGICSPCDAPKVTRKSHGADSCSDSAEGRSPRSPEAQGSPQITSRTTLL